MNAEAGRKAKLRLTIFFGLVFSIWISLGADLFANDPVNIAVFQGDGVGKSIDKLLTALGKSEPREFQITRIGPDEIRAGKLSGFDVLVHPGGSGSKQGKALGEEGRQAVREFTRNGGGVLCVCAGSYLAQMTTLGR